MTEDIDKELEGMLGDEDAGEESGDLDLGDLDLGDLDADSADDTEAGDFDLGDLDAGSSDDADAGDLDLGDQEAGDAEDAPVAEAEAGQEEGASGGEDFSLDDELQSMLDDPGGEGGGEPEAVGGEGDVPGIDPGAVAPAAPGQVAAAIGDALSNEQTINLEFLLDIKLHVTFEVGRAKMLISDLLTLGQGSVIELHRLVGDELDLLINGRLVARGEVVVVNEKFGCKITNIIPPEERVKYLGNL